MKRARHVITEIQRTRDAADALKKKDFVKVMYIERTVVFQLRAHWAENSERIIYKLSAFCIVFSHSLSLLSFSP